MLKIDPGHKQAKALLEGLDDIQATPKKASKARVRDLTPGVDFRGWVPGRNEYWSVSNGLLTGKADGPNGHINWLEGECFKGRYKVRVEFRILKGGVKRTCGLFVGNKHGENRWWSVMIDWNDAVALVETSPRAHTAVQKRVLRGFQPDQWHALEVDVRPGKMTVEIDGKKMFVHKTGDGESFDGELGIFVQDVHVLFRDLELRK